MHRTMETSNSNVQFVTSACLSLQCVADVESRLQLYQPPPNEPSGIKACEVSTIDDQQGNAHDYWLLSTSVDITLDGSLEVSCGQLSPCRSSSSVASSHSAQAAAAPSGSLSLLPLEQDGLPEAAPSQVSHLS
jgi:hypothetical protein